jgi:nucleotide-binding universal stress UspA family protein
MSKTIVLAVDTARYDLDEHVSAAVEMIKDLVHAEDRVIVLHVHEFAVGRFGRIQVDCAEGEGEQLVSQVVARLGSAGVTAQGAIREADYGHVARRILAEAENCNARMLVLGSSSRTDLPRVPLGSVSSRLLHIASLPVLIVPMHAVADTEVQAGGIQADTAGPASAEVLAT